MYAYYNSDKLFFMSNSITEIILATGEARFVVNLKNGWEMVFSHL